MLVQLEVLCMSWYAQAISVVSRYMGKLGRYIDKQSNKCVGTLKVNLILDSSTKVNLCNDIQILTMLQV